MQTKPSRSQILNIAVRAILLGVGTAFISSLIIVFMTKTSWRKAADRVNILPGTVACTYAAMAFYRLRQQAPPSNPDD